MSNNIKIPATHIKNPYNAIATFLIPRSLLDYSLTFSVALRDQKVITEHSLPNIIAGKVDIAEDLIKTSFFSKYHEQVHYKVVWLNDTSIYAAISSSKCLVELSARPVKEINEKTKMELDKLKHRESKENVIKNQVESKFY